MSTIIEAIEKKQMKENVPDLFVGDTVSVSKVIIEGKKQRIQKYEGVIVGIQGIRSRLSFTVRKIVDGIGVEKTYLLHSELVPEVKVIKRAKVRRARLNYLRSRIGTKATRLKSRD
jgi:large subunit ribosomal protein L19